MASEIKGIAKEIRLGKDRFYIFSLIGKNTEILYSETTKIEYRIAKINANGTFKIYTNNKKECVEFPYSQNNNLKTILKKIDIVLDIPEIIDLNVTDINNTEKPNMMKFLFPIPSIIIYILLGFILSFSTVSGNKISIGYWIFLMAILFVVFIFPLDIIYWLLKKIYQKLRSAFSSNSLPAQIQVKESTLKSEASNKIDLLSTNETEEIFILSDKEAGNLDKIQFYLQKADVYAMKLNQTKNVFDFFILYKNIENILEKYIQYEKYGIFKESCPSKDLSQMHKKKPLSEKAFIDRSFKYYKEQQQLYKFFSDLDKNISSFSKPSITYIKRLKEENIDLINRIISPNIHDDSATNTSIADNLTVLKNKDLYFIEAGEYIIRSGRASIGMLQRKFKIGFNRAAKIMDELFEAGVVGPELSTKSRNILLNYSEFKELCNYCFLAENYKLNEEITNVNLSIREYESLTYDGMSGLEFENFCSKLLENNGFTNVEVTQGSGDHGIDILAEKEDITYAIQCKCYSSNIGNAAVQQAHTGKSLYHKDIAVVLTNRYFTPQAIGEAKELGVKLWDRDKLDSMIEESMK